MGRAYLGSESKPLDRWITECPTLSDAEKQTLRQATTRLGTAVTRAGTKVSAADSKEIVAQEKSLAGLPEMKNPVDWIDHGSSCGTGSGQCFVGSTPVAVPHGRRPIVELRIGRRNWGHSTDPHENRFDPPVDPADRRAIRLVRRKGNAILCEIDLLRPLAWIDDNAIMVGEFVDLAMPEMGIDGPCEVLAIEPCPPIEPGPGCLITGVFRHTAGEILYLHIAGEPEPLGVTARHPFWSADRETWVPVCDLLPGERLSAADGSKPTVLALQPGGIEPTYNIEVDVDHCYRVGQQGLLVHNASERDVTCSHKDCNEVFAYTGVPECPHSPTQSNDPTEACKECNEDDDCPSCKAKDRQNSKRDYFRKPADHWNCYPYGDRSQWSSGRTASIVCGQCCQERVVLVEGRNATQVWIVQKCVCQPK